MAKSQPSQVKPTATPREAAKKPSPLEPKAPSVRGPRPLKVRATKMCYYDHARRRVGDVFYIKDQQAFSEQCMEYVDEATALRTTTAQAAIQEKHDEILAERTPGSGTDHDVL